MRIDRGKILGLALALVAMACAPALQAQSEVGKSVPTEIGWNTLSFRASRMGVRADSEIRMAIVPASEVAAQLIAPTQGTALGIDRETVVQIAIDSTVRGRESNMILTIDPETGGAFQRSNLAERKRETLYRTYRYLEDGVYIRRQLGPADGEGDPSDFPVTNARIIDYPPELVGQAVTDASALFYLLLAGDFQELGDTLTFYNFERDGMSEVVLTAAERTEVDVDYTEVSSAGERRVRESRSVIRLTVSGSTVGEGDDAFEFLGLRGNIEIFADPELRAPVAVRGRVPRAGNTTVRVRRIELP